MQKIVGHPRTVGFFAVVVAVCGSIGLIGPDISAQADGFAFAPIAFLGDPAPGGGTFLDVFESSFINNRGDIMFGSNVTANGEQGIFLLPAPANTLTEIARVGEPAPGGGVFGAGFGSPNALNDSGDVGFMFLLDPLRFPIGVNAGVYRYSQRARTLTDVMTPGVTPASDGGVFAVGTSGVVA